MEENMKKGQPDVNALGQKKGCYSKAEDLHHTLKTIRLWRPLDSEVHKILRDLDTTSYLSSFVAVSFKVW